MIKPLYMKRIYHSLLLISVIATACNKQAEIETPTLMVSADSAFIKTGQEVTFSLQGNADFVYFYSGIPLNDYAFKDDRILKPGIIKLSFDAYKCCATLTQTDQFHVMTSTNFDGIYNIADVQSATWTEITDRYTLPVAENAWAPAGNIDISDQIESGKPFYIAFKYTAQPTSVAGSGKIWKVRNLFLTSETEIGKTTLGDLVTSGWQLVYDENGIVDPTRNMVVKSALGFRANAAPHDTVYQETWIISKVFNVDEKDLGPDRALSIKGFTEPWVSKWQQVYAVPGTYTATFIGSNNNIYGNKQIVKQIKITVAP
jgi:hypothetical protein